MNEFFTRDEWLDYLGKLEDLTDVIEWSLPGNASGSYYDGVMLSMKLPEGKSWSAISPDGRVLLLIGHNKTCSIILEKYPFTKDNIHPFVLVGNVLPEVRSFTLTPSGSLNRQSVLEVVNFRHEHTTDMKLIDRRVDSYIDDCKSKAQFVSPTQAFWVKRYAPWRFDEFKIAYADYQSNRYPQLRTV